MAEKKSKLKKPKIVHDEITSPDEKWSAEQMRRGRREHFSLMALSGLCANPAYINVDEGELAANATVYADALIEELDKEKI